jgi:hypothetical protein
MVSFQYFIEAIFKYSIFTLKDLLNMNLMVFS